MLRSLIQNTSFNPEQIALLTEAYEAARIKLGLVARDDPATAALARKIIQLGSRGLIQDAHALCEQAVVELRTE
jgi:hypothetical protein